ncbi:hypothetical protein FK514_29890, partial [Klebsiella pneumoniae]|uniref:aquaporin n=1 Tax=Klebsiella pneumoniae TaxID=573 RepID=UPI00210CD3A3
LAEARSLDQASDIASAFEAKSLTYLGRNEISTTEAASGIDVIKRSTGKLTLENGGNGIPRGPLAPLLIGLLIAVIGASMGPLTGFALNPARDF